MEPSVKYTGDLPHQTISICPECKRPIEALLYGENDIVWMKKTCPDHGEFKEKYWESVEMYNREKKYGAKGKPTLKPNVGETENTGLNCPYDCGLCARHKSHTALANLVMTNRCDLSCWYCFFYAKEGQPIYEPDLKQIRSMLKNLRAEKPVPCNALQLTGGEPCLRDDLVEIVRMAEEEGFDHVQVNTDGIRLALNPQLAADLRAAGTNTVYMSFDGVTPKTNPKNHWEIPYGVENCRAVGMGIVLVPTVIGGVNDHELGDIINFALNHNDIIRGVNFQPVSLVGRMPQEMREKQRITIPRCIKNIEEQTNGTIREEDFFTVPSVHPITKFIEALTREPKYDLTTHFACGMATYLILGEDGRVVPLPQFVDVPGLTEYLTEKAQEIERGKTRYWVGLKVLSKLGSFIDKKKQPKGFDLKRILLDTLVKHNYRSLGALQHKSLFIGMMHFQDPYNYDVERVERCCIHYAMPDGRIIPFCTFNVIPEVYRDKVQAQYAMSAHEWEKKTGKKLADDKYRRDAKRLEEGEEYKKVYGGLKNYFK
jgi:uncharacterized radical SAM superfamily Fe-S cluster-containing enzyme